MRLAWAGVRPQTTQGFACQRSPQRDSTVLYCGPRLDDWGRVKVSSGTNERCVLNSRTERSHRLRLYWPTAEVYSIIGSPPRTAASIALAAAAIDMFLARVVNDHRLKAVASAFGLKPDWVGPRADSRAG